MISEIESKRWRWYRPPNICNFLSYFSVLWKQFCQENMIIIFRSFQHFIKIQTTVLSRMPHISLIELFFFFFVCINCCQADRRTLIDQWPCLGLIFFFYFIIPFVVFVFVLLCWQIQKQMKIFVLRVIFFVFFSIFNYLKQKHGANFLIGCFCSFCNAIVFLNQNFVIFLNYPLKY